MKRITSTILLIAGIASAAASQTLSKVATALFKEVKSTLTVAEKNQVATATGFVLSGKATEPFALDADSKDYPFTALVYPVDLNKDGKEEILISFGNTYTSGNTGQSISYYVKNAAGKYEEKLGFPGTLPEILAPANLGYPDILIGGPGFEFPVFRWNGKTYANHHTVKDSEYEKLKRTDAAELSKKYQESISQ